MEVRATKGFLKLKGNEIPMYMCFMRHEDLFKYSNIHKFDPGQDDLGYQRRLDNKNVTKIAEAYGTGRPIFAAVYVNARLFNGESVLKFRSMDGINGILEVPDEKVLYVLDGQHRIASWRDLSEMRLVFPVILFDGLGLREENMAFVDMNFMPKKPTKSHSQAIMLQIQETPSNKEQTAALITMKLNRRSDSPWYQRLTTEATQKRSSTSTKSKKGTTLSTPLATFSGLSDSIAWSLLNRDGSFVELSHERKVDVLIAYWKALKVLFPECWEQPRLYRLCQGFGPLAMHRLLAQYLSKKVDLETVTREEFERLLAPLASADGSHIFHYMEGPFKGISGKSAGTQNAVDAMRASLEARDLNVLYSMLGVATQSILDY